MTGVGGINQYTADLILWKLQHFQRFCLLWQKQLQFYCPLFENFINMSILLDCDIRKRDPSENTTYGIAPGFNGF